MAPYDKGILAVAFPNQYKYDSKFEFSYWIDADMTPPEKGIPWTFIITATSTFFLGMVFGYTCYFYKKKWPAIKARLELQRKKKIAAMQR